MTDSSSRKQRDVEDQVLVDRKHARRPTNLSSARTAPSVTVLLGNHGYTSRDTHALEHIRCQRAG